MVTGRSQAVAPEEPGAGDGGVRRRLSVTERRAEILRAAASAFAAASYDQVSIAHIAAESGSSQALVFHYFGTKAGLYAAVVQAAVDHLWSAQERAADELHPGVPVRDRVRASLEVYLDHVATHPLAWAVPLRGGGEPDVALAVRDRARAAYVDRLTALIGIGEWARHGYAVQGYFGFLDGACLCWVERGCPPEDRGALIDAALGALEGSLGDWAT